MLNKTKRKQVSRDVIHVSVVQTDHRQRPITVRVAFTSLYIVRCYRYLSPRIIYILPWHDWQFKVSLKFKSFINTRESHGSSFVPRLLKISLTRLLSSVR